ncbi:MAG: hypothetical protein NC204_01360 [Candidatus Amulumruptor caecigallinarius]|nr:hypothetical protein [Candidatus Amulumruptor caecigallinarius]
MNLLRARFISRIFVALAAITVAVSANAVTDKEMEEAKAITAKAYLRYVNDGSGYLDDVSAKSMSELTGKLKAKEKENLKAFNRVKIPSDYKSWDKEKLVEFWAVTFFTSSDLEAKGKAAKTRVRKQINAMHISAPAAEEKASATPEPATDVETPAQGKSGEEAVAEPAPTAEEAIMTQEDILQDQQEIAKDATEAAAPASGREQSHTWVYVLVLAILVGVVVWLVVYAAGLMKKQNGGDFTNDEGEESEADSIREKAQQAIQNKDKEIQRIKERLHSEEERAAAFCKELELLKLERNRLSSQLEKLREENMRMTQGGKVTSGGINRSELRQPRKEAAHTEKDDTQKTPVLKVIYLGRANRHGIFVRADRRISPGNTVYRLDTNDGFVGTFHVVDEPEVIDTVLSNPSEYLATGCIGENIEDTDGVASIVTESAGTAIFEDGCWKVLRKSRIRYE